jgi:hypothetical protein
MKTHMMFRILGENLDPNRITSTLSMAPTKAYAKNQEHTVPRIGITIRRPGGHWSFCTERFVSSFEVDDHAKYLLSRLEPKQKEIADLLKDVALNIGISVWFEIDDEHGSFSMPSDNMKRLALLCNSIEFHFIGTCAGEDGSDLNCVMTPAH